MKGFLAEDALSKVTSWERSSVLVFIVSLISNSTLSSWPSSLPLVGLSWLLLVPPFLTGSHPSWDHPSLTPWGVQLSRGSLLSEDTCLYRVGGSWLEDAWLSEGEGSQRGCFSVAELTLPETTLGRDVILPAVSLTAACQEYFSSVPQALCLVSLCCLLLLCVPIQSVALAPVVNSLLQPFQHIILMLLGGVLFPLYLLFLPLPLPSSSSQIPLPLSGWSLFRAFKGFSRAFMGSSIRACRSFISAFSSRALRGLRLIHHSKPFTTLNPIYIRTAYPLFPLGVRDSSAVHPLFPLCVRFAIILGNPFAAVIHFHPLLSARLPMNIRLTAPLHTTHARSFPFCFRKFSQRQRRKMLARPEKVCLWTYNYGGRENETLSSLRFAKFMAMVSSCKGKLNSCKLPPTDRAAHFHSLRAHLQILVWANLTITEYDQEKWGWKLSGIIMTPIMTDQDAAPQSLLQFVRCKCKLASRNPCGNNGCTCRKNGLKCVTTCGDCRGEKL